MAQRPVNPLVDCVFKQLLGSEGNEDILIDFLNAMLAPRDPIIEVTLLNPINGREKSKDDSTVVDVKARDQRGLAYQIEVQLQVRPHLPARVLYTWADNYQAQLQRGEDYPVLRPLIAIWLLGENLFRDTAVGHHRFHVVDQRRGLALTDHLEIHTIELRKGRVDPGTSLDSEERWIYFLRDGWKQEALPPALQTPALRKAMSNLSRWSQKEEDYHRYQARENFLREQRTMDGYLREATESRDQALAALAEAQGQVEVLQGQIVQERRTLEQERQAREQERRTLEQERQAREQIQAELEALRARLERGD